jgi:uracil-DNA glycosylase
LKKCNGCSHWYCNPDCDDFFWRGLCKPCWKPKDILDDRKGTAPTTIPTLKDIKEHLDDWKSYCEIIEELIQIVENGDDISEEPQEEGGVEQEEQEEILYTNTSLLEYTQTHIPNGWEEFFNQQLDEEYGTLKEISEAIQNDIYKGIEIYPPLDKIYKVFEIIKPKDVKVIIIGQDPYHDHGRAMGISFSVPEGIPLPPSLTNIYKEVEACGYTVNHDSGDLTEWCKQGVLLINTAFTVQAHKAGSHTKLWEAFTKTLMRWLNKNCEKSIIVMWGSTHAWKFDKFFDDTHRKIKSAHPSPLSAHNGFFGSQPFTKINTYLKQLKKQEINWSLT